MCVQFTVCVCSSLYVCAVHCMCVCSSLYVCAVHCMCVQFTVCVCSSLYVCAVHCMWADTFMSSLLRGDEMSAYLRWNELRISQLRQRTIRQIAWFNKYYVTAIGDRSGVAQWHRCCATNRKVTGSIPDGVIEIFHWHDSSDRTIALRSTQPLTEMSTRSIFWR